MITDGNDMVDYKKKYELLESKIKAVLSAQEAYFKSNKDNNLLKVWKGREADLKEFMNPKQKKVSQALIEWLAQ